MLSQLVRELPDDAAVDKWGYFRINKGDEGEMEDDTCAEIL